MDYMDLIQVTLNYIDEHILEKITVEELANKAGFSTYHYYKVFNSFIGIPVMEFVTHRKLQHALFDLSKGKKVLDIAILYGFETHAGFTKAFKKTFGYPPSFYRMHAPVAPPQRINLKMLRENRTGGIIMQPKIVSIDAFKIVGYEFKTTLRNNAHSRDIPAFWNNCNIEGKEATLYRTQPIPKHGEYGICVNTNLATDEFSYVLGVEVTNFNSATEDMYKLEVPSATYAVFTTPSVEDCDFVESIQGTWKYILEEWFPTSGYEIDDTKFDFEFYDQRCHTWEYSKVTMEIYVPIRKV
ncbi:transcriptional regulator, AraC family [Gottschalkia acidurici 9a]|uniref:Transcriptional regulator, AraC family n=1 Tax=Gottschalkia acidurici (strain ATCC 7906 / DSM 604 / BCRC 14475 / CIP 104303 / KCTC 5404 / NCIMB 10678 / 9a) TaxID=1128398 RepID=K0B5F3_GOTA9|nr:effector binding domain-containing protein [Gottschalkia acidurici]AFS79766.1 transcriptional regulator, AraC family [Gottschalkia acidurici 9a]